MHLGFALDERINIDDGEAVPGFETLIVKFPALGDRVDIGSIEHAYASMARAAGIEMAKSRPMRAGDGPSYFATRRFDRPALGRRLHMISFAGAVEAPPHAPSLDYDGFLRATLAITRDVRDVRDVEEVFRRMVFNVLASNRDDHSRQHAYVIDGGGAWHLAPAYGLTFSTGPGGEHYLAAAVAGEGRAPTRAHVEQLASTQRIAPRRATVSLMRLPLPLRNGPVHARAAGVGRSLGEIAELLDDVRRNFG